MDGQVWSLIDREIERKRERPRERERTQVSGTDSDMTEGGISSDRDGQV